MNDSIARNVFLSLVKDLRLLNGERFAEKALEAFIRGPKAYRAYVYPTLGQVPPMYYKSMWQLECLFKRYTFAEDLYSDSELEDLTYQKYLDFQQKRAVYTPFKTASKLVLKEARRIARGILSRPFSPDLEAKVGRRAEHGVKLSDAYFDNKLADPKGFTCSSSLRSTLNALRKKDPLFNRIFNRMRRASNGPLRLDENALSLTLVPKSWKTKRCITPLTTFGLYWSFGLGGYVERCLADVGLNIKTLQQKHKMLAREFSDPSSRRANHTTADLSSASDSLRSDILNAVLPRWFYCELRKTFVNKVTIHGKTYSTESVLPMGNGATFPVETLVFYCLIKAIGGLLSVKGTYSVYGDDLIYPTKIHPYVCKIFTDLGIHVNAEKTFAGMSSFRESCGGDYYRGVDVRPFLFPEESEPHGRLRRAQYLYKILNTLLRRWEPCEISHTLHYLLSELMFLMGEIYCVPPSFPDTSGLKTALTYVPWYITLCEPSYTFEDGTQKIRVRCLSAGGPKRRPIKSEICYLWPSLHRKTPPVIRYPREVKNFHHRMYILNCDPLPDPEYTLQDGRLTEPTHAEGRLRVCVSTLYQWT